MIVAKTDSDGLVDLVNLPDLVGVTETPGAISFTHRQQIDRIQEQVATLRQDTDRGFTEKRTMQWVARIPAAIYAQHPEFIKDPPSLDRWLMTDEGAKYRIADGVTSPPNRGKLIAVVENGKVKLYA